MSKDSTEAEKLMMGGLTLEYLRIRPEIDTPPIPTKSFEDVQQEIDASQINTERLEQLTDRLTTETERSEQLRNELEEKNKHLEKERQRENSNLAKAGRYLSQTGKFFAKKLGVPQIQTEEKSATLKAEEEIATTSSRLDEAQEAVTATLSEYPKLRSAASESADENLQVTYTRAKSHEKRHEYPEALDLYKKVADGELTGEKFQTDATLMAGKILAKDGRHEEAFRYFTQAAEADPIAAFEVALCYQNGLGTTKDQGKAVEYYRKAADSDITEDLARDDIRARAANNLGVCYEFGLGVEQSLSEASKMYEKSGLFNDNKRRLQLKLDESAIQTIETPKEQYEYALEIEKDRRRNPEHAFTLFKKAADAGYPGAAFKTAEYYDKTAKLDEAIDYYGRANNDVANYNIGLIYKNDKKDDKKAEEYFRLAATAGNSTAEAELKIYEEARKPVTPVTITSTELPETPTPSPRSPTPSPRSPTPESPVSQARAGSGGPLEENRTPTPPLPSKPIAAEPVEMDEYHKIVAWHNAIMDSMISEVEKRPAEKKEDVIKEVLTGAINKLWKITEIKPSAKAKEKIAEFSKEIAEDKEGIASYKRKGKGEGLRKFTKGLNRFGAALGLADKDGSFSDFMKHQYKEVAKIKTITTGLRTSTASFTQTTPGRIGGAVSVKGKAH